jgi:ankyrin repeat protein
MRTLLLVMLLSQSLIASAASPPAVRTSPTRNLGVVEVRTRLSEYFFDAARDDNRMMMNEFVKSGYDLNTRTEQGYTALILAAYHGHLDIVEQLIKAGADPCAQDKRGNTALMGALFKGELSIARRLMKASCKPDQRNNAGQTAAMYAALFGRTEVLKELQKQGADLDTEDAAGNSARTLANGRINNTQ